MWVLALVQLALVQAGRGAVGVGGGTGGGHCPLGSGQREARGCRRRGVVAAPGHPGGAEQGLLGGGVKTKFVGVFRRVKSIQIQSELDPFRFRSLQSGVRRIRNCWSL